MSSVLRVGFPRQSNFFAPGIELKDWESIKRKRTVHATLPN
jgi:hypothetical protein